MEALRRARRLLSSDGSRTLVRELCRGVLESYPKNEAALPILQESCDDTAGVDFLVNTLRTVLSRSQTNENWLRYADALIDALKRAEANPVEIFDLCLERLTIGGMRQTFVLDVLDWVRDEKSHTRLGAVFSGLVLSDRHVVESNVWILILTYVAAHHRHGDVFQHYLTAWNPLMVFLRRNSYNYWT